MRNSVRASMLTIASAIILIIGLATPAYAFGTGDCNGRAYNYILDYFDNPGHSHLPLRCGDSSFGLIHIIKRGHLNSSTSANIQLTLNYGQQKDPGAKILFSSTCEAIYTVAYGYNARNGNDPNANPIGIITAYPPTNQAAVKPPTAQLSPAATAGYRTDCPIFVPIGD